MKFWGSAPLVRLKPDSSWKEEYIHRSRLTKFWEANRRQKGWYHVGQQIGQPTDGLVWFGKDGKLRMALVSQKGLLMASFSSQRNLKRAVSYFSCTSDSNLTTCFSPYNIILSLLPLYLTIFCRDGSMWAVGDTNNRLCIYSVSMSHGGSNALTREVMLDPFRHQETLSHIQWTEEGLFVICHGLSSSSFFIFKSIEAAPLKASFDGYIGSFTEYLIFDDKDCFWLDGNRLYSVKDISGLADYPISYIFKISKTKLIIIPKANSIEWQTLDLQANSYERISIPGKSPISCAFAKYYCCEDYSRVLFIDQEGWQWLVTFYGSGSKYSFLRCSQGLHASPIKDVYFGTCVIIILRDQFVAIHDIENFKLLLWQPVQTNNKKSSADSGEPFIKKILCVLESDGILMLQWGGQVQVWNFGKKLMYLNPPIESSSKDSVKVGKKAEVQGILRYEYAEWQQEQRELAAMNMLRDKYNPEGMNEEELLAMALSISLSTAPLDGCHSHESCPSLPPSTDDEELRAVLERSRFEI